MARAPPSMARLQLRRRVVQEADEHAHAVGATQPQPHEPRQLQRQVRQRGATDAAHAADAAAARRHASHCRAGRRAGTWRGGR
eukprot:2038373-Prymnesium_polylepis.1